MREQEVLVLRDRLAASELTRSQSVAFGIEAEPHAVTLALGVTGGPEDYELAVRIPASATEADFPLAEIEQEAGGEIDVRQLRPLYAHQDPCDTLAPAWRSQAPRPLHPGVSCSHGEGAAGTLGCFVRFGDAPERSCLLSAQHVIARRNLAAADDPIHQPAVGDLQGAGVVGRLRPYRQLTTSGNLFDAAIAVLEEDLEIDPGHLDGLGRLSGLRRTDEVPLREGEIVFKIGRTTGVTTGAVNAWQLRSTCIRFDWIDTHCYVDQIEIQSTGGAPFACPGDSGALVVDEELRGLGLHVGGEIWTAENGQVIYASPLAKILGELRLTLLT